MWKIFSARRFTRAWCTYERLDGTEMPIFSQQEIVLDMVFLGVSSTSLHHATAPSIAKASEILEVMHRVLLHRTRPEPH